MVSVDHEQNPLNKVRFVILTELYSYSVDRTKEMEVMYVLSDSVCLNRKLDAPRTARDEKRRATHNEGIKLIYKTNDSSSTFM